MSDVSGGSNGRKLTRRQRSIYQVHYALQPSISPVMAAPLPLRRYSRQVAGHGGDAPGERYTGLLQCSDGKILKPILKESQKREIEFYETVTTSTRPDLVELRKFMPKYYGVKKFTYNGFEQEYIILEDLTEGMLEPCIMDIKIGRITYDPYASAEKMRREESKYARCKQEYCFCIPGYQLYRAGGPRAGELLRAGREQGKRLYGDQVVNVLRSFVTAGGGDGGGDGDGACRLPLLQLLGALWALQRWAARGGALLRAASLLLLYDAAGLRPAPDRRAIPRGLPPLGRRGSMPCAGPAGGPVPGSPGAPTRRAASPPPVRSPWSEALERLDHSHAFDNNYEDKLVRMRAEYRARLDRLASPRRPGVRGSLRVIDFAHAFVQEGPGAPDLNFKEGLDSLARVLEGLLKETEGPGYI